MKEYVATLTPTGQITIPDEVRKLLNLSGGGTVVFAVDDHGFVTLQSSEYPNVDSIVGIAGTLDREHTWDEMLTIAYEDRKIEDRKLP